jgi:hypothetical protein
MPWTEPLANSDELLRCIRGLVALSALPAAWRDYDMRQIGSSIVAALNSMVDADFVFIVLPGDGSQLITQPAFNNPKLNPASFDHVRAVLQREKARPGNGQEFIIAGPIGANQVAIAFQHGLGDAEKRRFATGAANDRFHRYRHAQRSDSVC